jgi:hypothetical protein
MRAEFKLDYEVRDDAIWAGSTPDSYYRHYSDRSARSLLSDADNRIPKSGAAQAGTGNMMAVTGSCGNSNAWLNPTSAY